MFISKISQTSRLSSLFGINGNKFVSFGVRGNLSPLKCDTFTFTGRDGKTAGDKSNYQYAGVLSEKLLEEAQPVFKDYKKTLEDVFKKCLVTDTSKPKTSAGKLCVQLKSKDSLRTKLVNNNINSVKTAKGTLNDIIRARIVLDKGSSTNCSSVYNALAQGIKDKKLSILEIRDYRTKAEQSYIIEKNHKKIADAVTSIGGDYSKVSLKVEPKDAGYIATHIIFKLKNGFSGELQIMGPMVEYLKDADDVIYKIETNAPISDKAQQDIKKSLLMLTKDQRKTYTEYIKDAYNEQRGKELRGEGAREIQTKIPRDSNIPSILDLNNIRKTVKDS